MALRSASIPRTTTTENPVQICCACPTGLRKNCGAGSRLRTNVGEVEAWCLNTLKSRPSWFTDAELFASGVAPNDDSYRNSGFDRGHMGKKLLVERLGRDAATIPIRY